MNRIKTICREWLNPKTGFTSGGVSFPSEYYRVGDDGVKEITANDSGCFNVEFETGEIISVTDVQYVEYFTQDKNIYENTECLLHKCNGCEKCFPKPEFPKDRENVQ